MMKAHLVICSLLLASVPALAQSSGGGTGPILKACRADIKTLCRGVQSGGGRIIACIREHQAEASEACQTALGTQPGAGAGVGAGAAPGAGGAAGAGAAPGAGDSAGT